MSATLGQESPDTTFNAVCHLFYVGEQLIFLSLINCTMRTMYTQELGASLHSSGSITESCSSFQIALQCGCEKNQDHFSLSVSLSISLSLLPHPHLSLRSLTYLAWPLCWEPFNVWAWCLKRHLSIEMILRQKCLSCVSLLSQWGGCIWGACWFYSLYCAFHHLLVSHGVYL